MNTKAFVAIIALCYMMGAAVAITAIHKHHIQSKHQHEGTIVFSAEK